LAPRRFIMQRLLIVVGVILVVAGLSWPWLGRIPWGRLPGDIHVERDGFGFYFPLTTGLLVSLVVSLIVWFLRR
jgi:hypothetical protein